MIGLPCSRVMKLIRRRVAWIAFNALACSATAQRYASEVFGTSQIAITPDVPFAENIDFLHSDFSDADIAAAEILQLQYFVLTGQTIPATFFLEGDSSTYVKLSRLRMDVYQPDQALDCDLDRPLFIYLHSGDLIPPPLNGVPYGTRKDSCAVEICTRMARRGYVAASMDYRLGWDPGSSDPQTRRGGFVNAVYRAVQDVRQGIRALKAAAGTYHLRTDGIIVCGEGIGGTIALGAATLDDVSELYIEKLLPDVSQPDVSYVDTALAGTPDGFNGQLNLYRPNGYDGTFGLCVNLGGALIDTGWLAPGDVPMLSFQPVFDQRTPFTAGGQVAGSSDDAVLPVHGAGLFQQVVNAMGNNTAFAGFPDGDPFTDRARDLYGTSPEHTSSTVGIPVDAEGLFPIVTPDWPVQDPGSHEETAPWAWWDPNSAEAQAEVEPGVTAHDAALASNPDMSPAKGRAYVDTIIGYMGPRIIAVFDLAETLLITGLPCDDGNASTFGDVVNEDCICAGVPDGIEEAPSVISLHMGPNPVQDVLTIWSDNASILSFQLVDAVGRPVRSAAVNAYRQTIDRAGLASGTYLLSVMFGNGRITRMIAVE